MTTVEPMMTASAAGDAESAVRLVHAVPMLHDRGAPALCWGAMAMDSTTKQKPKQMARRTLRTTRATGRAAQMVTPAHLYILLMTCETCMQTCHASARLDSASHSADRLAL